MGRDARKLRRPSSEVPSGNDSFGTIIDDISILLKVQMFLGLIPLKHTSPNSIFRPYRIDLDLRSP